MARKYRVTVNGKAYDVDVEEMGAGVPAAAPAPAGGGAGAIEAPMPGKVLKVLVSQGAPVTAGQLVLILEAMKMENEIYATAAGTVTQVGCKEGDSVNTGDTLLVIG
jgi:glutaconyl-CoA decarboxylase